MTQHTHATLVKTQRILEVEVPDTPDGAVTFAQRDDDTRVVTTAVIILEADWRAMGSPEKVTVTLEPGDLLNAPHRPEIVSTNTFISTDAG